MIKRIICLIVILIICLGLFCGCNKETDIDASASDDKAAIDVAENKNTADSAINQAKNSIDEVSSNENKNIEDITVDDFRLLVSIDKSNYQIGEKIIVTVTLENLSNKDITIELPDWIATTGGSQLEDVLVCYFLPRDSGFDWTVTSIAIFPRPRMILEKGAEVKKIFEYTVSETNNMEIHAGAFFYFGEVSTSRFNQQISLINNPIKIMLSDTYQSNHSKSTLAYEEIRTYFIVDDKYTDDFGGVFIDSDGIYNICVVGNREPIKSDYLIYNKVTYSYNFLESVVDEISKNMKEFSTICMVGVRDSLNKASIYLEDESELPLIIEYLETKGLYQEGSLNIVIGKYRIVPN